MENRLTTFGRIYRKVKNRWSTHRSYRTATYYSSTSLKNYEHALMFKTVC